MAATIIISMIGAFMLCINAYTLSGFQCTAKLVWTAVILNGMGACDDLQTVGNLNACINSFEVRACENRSVYQSNPNTELARSEVGWKLHPAPPTSLT